MTAAWVSRMPVEEALKGTPGVPDPTGLGLDRSERDREAGADALNLPSPDPNSKTQQLVYSGCDLSRVYNLQGCFGLGVARRSRTFRGHCRL